ncbi:MAG: RNA methyltransferase, partial [Dissulfurimicrobium sp.]
VSAVTNLDIHDIARASMTYGVDGYYVVTPVGEQQALVKELVRHWSDGVGSAISPDRRTALELVRVAGSLKDVCDDIALKTGGRPVVYATTAREVIGSIGWRSLREKLRDKGFNLLLIFGTAFGLAPEVFDLVDGALAPIEGVAGYNHLSVRSAAAIALDRLFSNYMDI